MVYYIRRPFTQTWSKAHKILGTNANMMLSVVFDPFAWENTWNQ